MEEVVKYHPFSHLYRVHIGMQPIAGNPGRKDTATAMGLSHKSLSTVAHLPVILCTDAIFTIGIFHLAQMYKMVGPLNNHVYLRMRRGGAAP